MKLDAQGRSFVVTGASRGIGREVTRQLALAGGRVFAAMRSPENFVPPEAPEGSIEALELDVSSDGSVQRFVSELRGRTEVIHGLANNAGVFPDGDYGATLATIDFDSIRRAFETNTLGALRVSAAISPFLSKGGAIVNVSSGMGQLSEMNGGAYAYRLSKTALNAVTRILSNELSGRGICVNSVCPGWVKTDMGGPGASRSVEKGAETIVWLLLLGSQGPQGQFLRDQRPIAW